MTTIKLYDSAINAINGQPNPQSQVGDTQNVDIQDILEMIREGRLTEAVELLNQAGITSMTTEENGTKVVTFKFENRNYTIRYNVESPDVEDNPIDTKTDSPLNDVSWPEGNNFLSFQSYICTDNYQYQDITKNAEWAGVFSTVNAFGYPETGNETYSQVIIDGYQKLCEYLGIKYYTPSEVTRHDLDSRGLIDTPSNRIYTSMAINDANILSAMNLQKAQYINEHPELFNGIILQCESDPRGGYFSGIATSVYTDYLRCQNGEMLNSEQLYANYIAEFSDRLNDTSDLPPYTTANPAYNVKLNGDTIEFTENTVQAIKNYLERCYSRCEEPCNFVKNLGINRGDSEETIWEKINTFCIANGSTDGKTLSLADYYDVLAKTAGCTKDDPNTSIWPTKEQCGIILSDYQNGLKTFFEDQGIPLPSDGMNTQGNPVPARTLTSALQDTSVSSLPTMPVGGIEITDDDIEYARKEKQQQIIDDFIKNIKQFNNYRCSSDPKSFGSGNIPIYAVELDGNGNVIIGDKFKDALKKYFTALINAIKADIARYDSNLQGMRDNGSPAGTTMTALCQEQFLALFDLTKCPMDFTEPYAEKPNMEAWMADIQSYIDDDAKMNDLLSTFCKNLGSTDGKSVSVEQYYNKLAENNIYEYISAYGQSKVTFSKDNNIESYAKIDAYLSKLQENYPEVYNDYHYYISSGSSIYYDSSTGKVRGDSYISLQGSTEDYANPQFNDVLRVAAGITGNDSFSEQREKMKNLFIKMGADPKDMYFGVDVTQLMNYLLGDNSEHVNYFDQLKAQRNALTEKLINTQLEIGVPDSNIQVEKYEPPENVGTTRTSDIIDEISDYLKELVQPIYDKYYIFDANDPNQFTNFTQIPYIHDPDDPGYVHLEYVWKDTALKEACAKEMEEAAQKLLEKYPDMLTSVIYDGQRILFSTVYDDDSPNNGYSMIGLGSMSGTSALHGLAHTAGGPIHLDNLTLVPSGFEATIDSPKIYSSTPKVIENNIPQNAPVGLNGENLIKTAWDGIWVSENGDYIYLWDSKNQKYLAVENYYGGLLAQSLANGVLDCLPVNNKEQGGYEIDNILLSLVYGYNRTESPYIFEKDGKYYAYDEGVQSHNGYTGLELLKDALIEISIENEYKPNASTSSSVHISSTQVTQTNKTLGNNSILTSSQGDNANNRTTDAKSQTMTKQELYNMGFTSELYLKKYFDQHDDGTYCLKEPCLYEGEVITSIDDLKSKLQLLSINEYIEDKYITRNSDKSLDIKNLLGFKINGEWNYDNLQSALKGIISGSKPPASWGYSLEENFAALAVKNGWNVTSNPTNEDIEAIITKCIEEIAQQNGCNTNDVSSADLIKYMYNNSETFAQDFCRDFEKENMFHIPSLSFDLQSLKDFGTNPEDALNNFLLQLETGDIKNSSGLKAIYEAAGIIDNDSIGTKQEKLRDLMNSIEQIHQVNGKDSWDCLEEYLYINGYFEEESYTKEKLIQMGIDETIMNTYFYSEEALDGGVVYKLKSSSLSLENVLLEIKQKKIEEEENISLNTQEPASLVLEIKSYTDVKNKLEVFAKMHNLSKVENMTDVYQDENGIYYYIVDAEGLQIGCSDYENSKYKSELKTNEKTYAMQIYILSNLGAVNYIPQRPDAYQTTILEPVYYQTDDGNWHKLTMHGGIYNMDILDWSHQSYDIFLRRNDSKNWFDIVDVAEEEVLELVNCEKTPSPSQPTTNNPITNDDNSELTYSDARAMFILQNFLNTDIVPNQENSINNLDVDENGNTITEANWQDYLLSIGNLTKEELIEQVLDKLLTTSQDIVLSNISYKVGSAWPLTIISAMGGNLISTHEIAFSHYANEPYTVTFELNNHTYTIPFRPRIGGEAEYNPEKWYSQEDLSNIKEKFGNSGYSEQVINEIMQHFRTARAIDNNISDYYFDYFAMDKDEANNILAIINNQNIEKSEEKQTKGYYDDKDETVAAIATELGYEKGDDGNYYYGEGNNTYICLWNPWTEKFDKYLVASEEPENVELEPNEDGGFEATVPTLDNLFAESCIAAKAEGFIPSDDTGVFERDNERYVYDITTHTFIKESDATKTNKKTWVQVFREAYSLAQQLGYKPSSIAFCIFEDTNGNQFKYDVDEGKFIALS